MVLMHGLGGSTNVFEPLIRHFATSYTMLRFDFFGSGMSKFTSAPIALSIPYFLSDLQDLVASRTPLEAPILIGHSLGSIIAMHYAAKHPNTGGIALLGPGRSTAHIAAVVERMNGTAETARLGMEFLVDSTVANNVAPTSSDLVRTIVRQMTASQDPEGYAATCRAICASSHVDPDYSAIACPTVLIAGEQDKISPLAISVDLEGLISAGRTNSSLQLRIVKSGHQQVLEDTHGVIAAIRELLDVI